MQIEVILTPAEIALLPQRDLAETVCVVFDVLRATSTFLTALAQGARRIYPVGSIAEAVDLQRRLPDSLLGGERGGVRLDGFDLGNSPREYTGERVAGREIIATTTNGTIALRSCAHAAAVHAGALLNLNALAAYLGWSRPSPERLLLVCAGTGAEFALEDGFAAGALLTRLAGLGHASIDDAGQAMRALHAQEGDAAAADVLQNSANGRRLQEIGLGADVPYCASIGSVDAVAIMQDRALELTGL